MELLKKLLFKAPVVNINKEASQTIKLLVKVIIKNIVKDDYICRVKFNLETIYFRITIDIETCKMTIQKIPSSEIYDIIINFENRFPLTFNYSEDSLKRIQTYLNDNHIKVFENSIQIN